MGITIKLAAVGAVAFMALDGVWLGLLMKHFYREQLAPIVRLADGGIAPNWPAAFVVYVPARDRHCAVRHPARVDRPRSPPRYGALFGAGRVRRLRLHQLLDAAPVAVRVDARRHGVGRRGVRRLRGRRPDRGPMSAPPRGARALSDSRGLQTDRDRDRHAACMGAALRRGHAYRATNAAACIRTPTSRGCGSWAAPSSTDTASAGSPVSATMNCAIFVAALTRRRVNGRSRADPARYDRAYHGAARVRLRRSRSRALAAGCDASSARPPAGRADAGACAGWRRLAPGPAAHRARAPDVFDDAEPSRLVPPAVRAP